MSQVDSRPVAGVPGNVASTGAANTSELITFLAVPGKAHQLTGVIWSYSAAPTGGRLTVEDGVGNRIFDIDIIAGGPGTIPLPSLRGSLNTSMLVTLFAGAGAVIGKLNAYKSTRA